jgi:hypothetical protein
MTSQSVFWAAFLGVTVGILAVRVFMLTVFEPLLASSKRKLHAYMKKHRVTLTDVLATNHLLAECECCVCGDKHTKLADSDGKIA